MLRAVYKCGSQLFLSKPHDIDVLMVYDTRKECREAIKMNADRSVDKHYMCMENLDVVFLGCYARPFLELIEGQEIEKLKNFSIFDHEEEYKSLLRGFAHSLSKEHKYWYHIYIAVRMFDKGKMSLTKKEKETAQKIHDKGINEELYAYIIDFLG